ncbi:MAG: hybrid sensor histidine kinase/response regulator [Chloroflexota bacterium]
MPNEYPRLLVADDDELSLMLIQQILHDVGDIDTVTNGRDALLKIEETEYDIVILDLMMPVMTGLDILQIIRSTKDISALPVILVSGIRDEEKVAWGIRMGANDYVSKPLDTNVMHARVNTQLRLKRLHDERNLLINRLQSASQLKTRMMQIASHDLKNPMNNLTMLTEIMMREADDNQKLTQMLQTQRDSLNTMVTVVNDFLDASQSTDGVSLQLERIHAIEILQQVVRQYSVMASSKQIDVKLRQIRGTVIGDERRLSQVIGNLISNAIKYSPTESDIYVYTEIDPEQMRWRLNVVDSGQGIPEEEQQYLFKPFSKSKISTEPTAGEASTGLGLWIVAEMMKIQKGDVGMYNDPEGGACFWIELPLAPDEVG